jgi:3-oxoadipate enol-lactonase
MPLARMDDVELYYEEHGRGESLLLVAPSWWPCDTWNVAVVPTLSQHYRTVIFDARGTGYSSKPDHGYTINQFAQDSIALLGHLGIARCHAVGFALGGQIVQAMAVERPDLIASLTMAAVGAGTKPTQGDPREATNNDDREIRELGFERFIRGHVENDHMAFGSRFYCEHPDVVAALSQALWERQTSPEQYRYHYDARRTWDTLGNAAKIKVSTLILCGAEDHVNRGGSTPVGTARRLAELVAGAELILLPDVKHMTFWDGTEAVSRLREFLSRHPI